MAMELSDAGYGVLSAFVDTTDDDNTLRHIWLREELRVLGYDPIEVVGKWEGIPELAWVVPCIPQDDLVDLAVEYGQKAIVYCPPGGHPALEMIIT